MLPISLLPTKSPALSLMAMPESEFFDLYIGEESQAPFEDEDVQIIQAFDEIVIERAMLLISDWQHREAVIDIVTCFTPIMQNVSVLDETILKISAWLCRHGTRVNIAAKGSAFEQAQAVIEDCLVFVENNDFSNGDPNENYQKALKTASELSKDCSMYLDFETIEITLFLKASRVQVLADLPNHGEIDLGGHYYDGDEDADGNLQLSPLVTI